MRVPSGLNCALVTAPSCPASVASDLAGGCVPHARGLVLRRRDDARAVRAELRAHHRFLMSGERRQRLARGGVPHARGLVVRRRDDARAVRAELRAITASSCPASVASALPVAASHTRAVLSYDAVTMRVPSGLNCAPSPILMSDENYGWQDRDSRHLERRRPFPQQAWMTGHTRKHEQAARKPPVLARFEVSLQQRGDPSERLRRASRGTRRSCVPISLFFRSTSCLL